jgi:guanylate cyclase
MLRRLLERLGDLGTLPGDSHDEALRKGTLIFASVLISLISFVWVGTYAANSHPLSAAIPATFQVGTALGLVALARWGHFAVFRTTQFVMFLVLPALLQASLGGFVASSGMVLWAMFTPLAALALLGLRRSVPWLVLYFAEVLVLGLVDHRLAQSPAELPGGIAIAFFVLNILGVTLSAFVMLGYFVEQRERARMALEAEQERSERLLLNVLPAPIAQRLKAEHGVIAEHYDAVSVLFADLVGFTERVEGMPPTELITLLDRIFSAFDRVAETEGVEKIKTIGDAYMVAMRREICDIAAHSGYGWLAVRIGIDTGPAVAGVIGRRKFIYDLWGDTVNTASRMESHGLPGEIQLTARAAVALGAGYSLRSRGTILVKGKGPMETFLLEDAPAGSPS